MASLPAALLLALWLPGVNQGAYRVDTGLYAALGLHAWRDGPLWPLLSGDSPYFNKPPLALWIHGLFLHMLGTELWVARLPSLLVALACVGITRRMAGLLSGPSVGTLAACILALTLEFFRYTKAVSLDLWLTMFLLLGTWCMALALSRGGGKRLGGGRRLLILLSGLPIGLGLLVKPLVALLAIPIFAAWIFVGARAMAGETPHRERGRGLAGDAIALTGAMFIALGAASCWYLPMYVRFGGMFVDQHFTKQAIERATGESFGADPWWFYLRLLSETYWPWLLAALSSAALLLRRGLRVREHRAAVLSLSWCLVWLAALSCFAGKSGRYAVPLYPFLAWFGAIALGRYSPRWVALVRRALLRWLAPIALVGAVVMAAVGVRVHAPATPHWEALYEFVRSHNREDLWAPADMLPTCANVYLFTGRWPRTIGDSRTPPAGAIVLYRDEVDSKPAAHEVEFWRNGPMFAVRTEIP